MTRHIRRIVTIAVLGALLSGCVSNPTPHPGRADGTMATDSTAGGVPGGDGQGQDGARAVCDSLGGSFDDDAVCDLGLESSFDADPSPPIDAAGPVADVTAVSISGEPQAYTFEVTVLSADTGCESYADWWEVLSLDGELRYRRILGHSHVDEQPFVRAGGPVPLDDTEPVVIRAHRHPEGYVGLALVGTVSGGFASTRLPDSFATAVADEAPQPGGCAF